MIATLLEATLLCALGCMAVVTGWLHLLARRGDRLPLAGWHVVTAVLGATAAVAVVAMLHPDLPRVVHLWSMGPFGIELLLDRVSLLMLAVVAFIGFVVHRHAYRYLAGEMDRTWFFARLAATTLAAQLLVVSANLAMLALCWVLVGVWVQRLLGHYGSRPRAMLAARKKMLVGRLGDVALITGCGLCLQAFGTLDVLELSRSAALSDAPGVGWLGLVFALAAVCKSAVVPFHAWLPDSLEAPTPVSALLHAGIVNGGGYLLVRVAPVMAQAEAALAALVVIGTLTAAVGTMASWAQTEIKRSLAWSTVGQMGFTVLQCGLGAFGPALVHLAGHGLYKAHAFLRSGSHHASIERPRRKATAAESLATLAGGVLMGAAVVWLVLELTGYEATGVPGGVTLLALLPIALAQLLVPVGAAAGRVSLPMRGAAVIVFGVVSTLLVVGAKAALGDGLAASPPLGERGAGTALQVLVLGVFAGLAVLGAVLPAWGRRGALAALHVHSLHGFYLGAWIDRWVRRLWPASSPSARASAPELWRAHDLGHLR